MSLALGQCGHHQGTPVLEVYALTGLVLAPNIPRYLGMLMAINNSMSTSTPTHLEHLNGSILW